MKEPQKISMSNITAKKVPLRRLLPLNSEQEENKKENHEDNQKGNKVKL
jgi:hypothetical protein